LATPLQEHEPGFILGHALRDDAGEIINWRYDDVNAAWAELVGIDADEARGRTIQNLIPEIEDEWVTDIARVVDTRQPLRFTRQVGVLGRWFDGVAQPVGADGFTVIFYDVTDRIHAGRRRDAVIALADTLRDETDISAMTRKAGEIIGEALGAIRAAFGELQHDRGQVVIDGGWAKPGAPLVEGLYSFSDYGSVLDDLLAGRLLVIDDVRRDDRTNADLAQWRALNTQAVVNVPVRQKGRTVAVLFVHHERPHAWSDDEVAFLQNAADRLEVAIAHRRAADQQGVINGEIAHRLKNTLAMVQAIASQTLRTAVDPEALDGFMRRLQALGTAHDALTASHWQQTNIEAVIRSVLDALGLEARCSLAGPKLTMGARAGMATSLLIHELATNAVKYGALSCEEGSVMITWNVDSSPDPTVHLDWQEQGGPEVVEPKRKGFGSKLVRLGLIELAAPRFAMTSQVFRQGLRRTLNKLDRRRIITWQIL
jgi:two-component sensor histidine kinase